ncbi:hypothetical protein ABNF97_33790 [Plantactinospora sp. B6F1]|uniref:hypothetical protein n=1 Tax=Plantactinospora sp. B6F1 TaxID=3158971 RepID=UPI0032D96C22
MDRTAPQRHVGWFRRTMCLLTLHSFEEMPHDRRVDPANPCRQERRCVCGRTPLPTRSVHKYGEPTDGNRLCERVETCVRCGYEKYWLSHQIPGNGWIPVRDVPEHRRKGYDTSACQYAFLCVVCGDIAMINERHDWAEEWWGRKCRDCGWEFHDDGE